MGSSERVVRFPRDPRDRARANRAGLPSAVARRLLLACALTALVGAAGRGAVQPPPARIALSYPPELVAKGFPTPMFRWTVNGRSAWFLVDTGAGVNVAASWFVEAAKLSTAESEVRLLDATGERVPTRLVRDLRGTLADGSTLAIGEATVAEFPPIFRDHELGGLVSPQLLAPEGAAAVLDLRVPALSYEPFATARRRLAARETTRSWTICHNDRSKFDNLLFVAPVEVEGFSCRLLVDSGADTSELHDDAPVVAKLTRSAMAGGKTMGVRGAATEIRSLRKAMVRFAGRSLPIDLHIGKGTSSCPSDGVLGMDVLQGCALVLARGATAVLCDPPRASN
jgi:hypothetical protein